jgi:hypothetical protein
MTKKKMFRHLDLEDVLEHSVIDLQDGVLRREVEGEAAVERILEAAVGKVDDGGFGVVHAHGNAGAIEVVDGEPLLAMP